MNDKSEMGEIVTGLLYIDPLALDLHASLNSSHLPLNTLKEKELCPGEKALSKINQSLR
jgi:2-oxoglutarate ferredoxin oxidoreductase subunit beta